MNETTQACRERMRKGSLSFSFAARLLGVRIQESIYWLYAWCRYCDDRTDDLPPTAGIAEREALIDELQSATRACYTGAGQENPAFAGFGLLVRRSGIPAHYPNELLEGMRMDLSGYQYETLDDLLLYCYRVAGVVGLMTCHVFGISDERALRHAADLGTAMQLTNIARDIYDDLAIGRVYIPREWIDAAHGDAELSDRGITRELALRLVTLAEGYYRSGDQGLRYLPFRCAFAVAAARHIYAAIGHQVARRGSHAWDTRTWVPGWKKLFLLGYAIRDVLKTLPYRLNSANSYSTNIKTIWRQV